MLKIIMQRRSSNPTSLPPPTHTHNCHNLLIAFSPLIKSIEDRNNNSYDQCGNIFKAFYTTKSAKGIGLDLSIVKRLEEVYESSIAFEFQVERGTACIVYLKFYKPHMLDQKSIANRVILKHNCKI